MAQPHDTQAHHQPPFATGTSFQLAGPSVKLDPAKVPVRGDLAHVRMAGVVFVPHYIVPMPHKATQPCAVLTSPSGEAQAMLAAGERFDVLDVAGGMAWGESERGPVGYVALADLERM